MSCVSAVMLDTCGSVLESIFASKLRTLRVLGNSDSQSLMVPVR